MNFDKNQLLDAVGAGLSEDGTIAELIFRRANGQTANFQFNAADIGSVMFNIERALAGVFEKQRAMLKGQGQRTFFALRPKHVVAIQGGVDSQSRPIVSLLLKSGISLDFRLERKVISELIAWLQQVEDQSQKPPRAHN